MSIADHSQVGLGPRVMVKIVTVDVKDRRIEGALRDGGLIYIAVFDTREIFVWPQQGEFWLVRKENNIWMLDKRLDSLDDHTLDDLVPGEAKIYSNNIKDLSGKRIIASNDSAATDGQILTYSNENWVPLDPSITSVSVGPSGNLTVDSATGPVVTIDLASSLSGLTSVSASNFTGDLTGNVIGNASTADKVNHSLTAGTGLTYGSSVTFDGSADRTIAIDSTVITTSTSIASGDLTGNYPNPTLVNISPDPAQSTSGVYKIKVDSKGRVTATSSASASDVGALASTSSLASIASANASASAITASSQNITNLADPRIGQPQDAATKAYVDLSVSALSANRKDSVNFATTGTETSYTISGGAVTAIDNTAGKIDNHSVSTNDRILIKDAPTSTGSPVANSSSPANGIYKVTSASGTTINLTRADDMDASAEVYNAYTFVTDGNTNIGTSWGIFTFGTLGGGTLNTDNIKWIQTGASVVYQGSSSINITGTTISVSGTIANSTIWNGSTIQPAYGGTGITSLGTGVATALGVNVGSTGGFVTDNGSATLSNKTISGSSNTITNIGNSSLTNSTISGVSLGGTLANLTIGTTGLKATTGSSPYTGTSAVTIDIDSIKVPQIGTNSNSKSLTFNLQNTTDTSPSLTYPTSTENSGALVTKNGTQTLTNKTLTSPTIGGTATFSASTTIDAGSNKITNVTDPTSAQDAATKNYVESSDATINKTSVAATYVGSASAVSISSTTWTWKDTTNTAIFSGASLDGYGFGPPDSSGNFVIPYSGIYIITASCTFNQNATGGRGIRIYDATNSAVLSETFINNAGASTRVTTNVSILWDFNANDLFRIELYQNSGGNLSIVNTYLQPRMGIAMIGGL